MSEPERKIPPYMSEPTQTKTFRLDWVSDPEFEMLDSILMRYAITEVLSACDRMVGEMIRSGRMPLRFHTVMADGKLRIMAEAVPLDTPREAMILLL